MTYDGNEDMREKLYNGNPWIIWKPYFILDF